VGLTSMIVPFNFPINLAAHKVGPAIAAGCPFVLKPSDRTPVSATIMGEMLANTSLPDGAFSVLPALPEDASIFSTHPDIKMVSFTGSVGVGWAIKAAAGKKKVLLELGGNAASIVDADADVTRAVARHIFGAFFYSGQTCISVQRIFVHEQIYKNFLEQFTTATRALKMGNPEDETTSIGPIISEKDAIRLETWTKKAVAAGGRLVTGGKRTGVMFEPTIVENCPPEVELTCSEAFGPICTIEPFKDFKAVVEKADTTCFGLQTGVFTRDIHKAFYAYRNLHVGGVVINDVPSVRVDSMPYGGVKDSGVGKEGVRYSIEEMTELKTMVLKDI
jgi:acyl-CoA reductase-like NAD-dependent aldehyde dehydrogenase